MADNLPISVDRLPTLTEVLELGRELPAEHWTAAPIPDPNLNLIPDLSSEGYSEALSPAVFSLADARAAEQALFGSESASVAVSVPSPTPRLDEVEIVERVLAALRPRIDSLLEARVSEALAPALARAADMLIRESREELVSALRALAEESLAHLLRQNGSGSDQG